MSTTIVATPSSASPAPSVVVSTAVYCRNSKLKAKFESGSLHLSFKDLNKARSTRSQPGVNPGSTWRQPGVNLGSTWGQPGVNLGSTWGQPGVNLSCTRDQPGVNPGSTCTAPP